MTRATNRTTSKLQKMIAFQY
ncbi:hypothetical protein BCEP4_630021 [Burkholderia cepacia]|nr:hypothetical protein BCEP4_630021 [Burkholderia cepacia]